LVVKAERDRDHLEDPG